MTAPESAQPGPQEQLEALSALLSDARSVPLSTSAMVDRDQALDLVHTAIASLPGALREARWVLEDRTAILERARADAENLVTQAGRERDELVSQSEILRSAQREAVAVLEAARAQAQDLHDRSRHESETLRADADAYVDDKLAGLQEALERALDQVERGRYRLRRDRDPLAAEADEAPRALDAASDD